MFPDSTNVCIIHSTSQEETLSPTLFSIQTTQVNCYQIILIFAMAYHSLLCFLPFSGLCYCAKTVPSTSSLSLLSNPLPPCYTIYLSKMQIWSSSYATSSPQDEILSLAWLKAFLQMCSCLTASLSPAILYSTCCAMKPSIPFHLIFSHLSGLSLQ